MSKRRCVKKDAWHTRSNVVSLSNKVDCGPTLILAVPRVVVSLAFCEARISAMEQIHISAEWIHRIGSRPAPPSFGYMRFGASFGAGKGFVVRGNCEDRAAT